MLNRKPKRPMLAAVLSAALLDLGLADGHPETPVPPLDLACGSFLTPPVKSAVGVESQFTAGKEWDFACRAPLPEVKR